MQSPSLLIPKHNNHFECQHRFRILISFNDKPRIQQVRLVIFQRFFFSRLIYFCSGCLGYGMTGSRIPLHGRSKTGIFIGQSLTHFANLDGTAYRHQLHMRVYLSLFLNILFRFGRRWEREATMTKTSFVSAQGIRNADAFISSSERPARPVTPSIL